MSKKEKQYTWEQINQALTNKGIGAKFIVRLMFELNRIHREDAKFVEDHFQIIHIQ